jgi:ribosomal protein S18 acetylase RimI-like enzyme
VSITFERLTEDTIPAADAVLVAAFGGNSRTGELRTCLALQPDGWRLARVDGRAVGCGGAVDYGPFAYIGWVGVLPTYQRRGVATALMRDLLAWLDARGCPVAMLDASAAGAHVYPHLGFVTDDTVAVWRLEEGVARDRPFMAAEQGRARPFAPPDQEEHGGQRNDGAGRVRVRVLTVADLDEVCAFDAPRFGADRRPLLALALTIWPGRAFVARDAADGVAGFLVAQELNLGPWMASTPEAARALLGAALTLRFDGGSGLAADLPPSAPPQVRAPTANDAAAMLLEEAGFTVARTLQHMRRGGLPLLDRRRTLYGQASFALG